MKSAIKLDRLQEQLQRIWDRCEAESNREIRGMMWRRYNDLEARERELLAEIKSERGRLEKAR